MILLASKSPGRLATLRAAGVEPVVRVSDVDESAVLAALARERRAAGDPDPSGAQQVQALARAKAWTCCAPEGPGTPAARRSQASAARTADSSTSETRTIGSTPAARRVAKRPED